MTEPSPLPRQPLRDELGALGDSVEAALSEALLAERERAAFLADASRALAGSLNVDRLALRVLRLAVPRLGTTAALCLTGPAGCTWTVERGTEPTSAQELPPGLPGHLVDHAVRTGRTRPEAGALAVPLVARGTPFGALLLAGGPYDEPEVLLAEDFAQRAALAVDAARVFGERNHIAKVLEANLRPPELPPIPGLLLATGYRSAADSDGLGGDFYDVHGSGDDWTVVLGDVCGKGVEAAVVTGRTRESIRTAAHVDRRPGRVLDLLNRTLLDVPNAPFVTLVCARLRPLGDGSVRLDLASAGHPAPLVVRRDGSVEPVPAEGIVAGVAHGVAFEEVQVRLAPGDVCVLFTDGVTEARCDGDMFGLERLVATVREVGAIHPRAVVDCVLERVLTHLDGRPHDDIALLVLQAAP